MKKLLSLILVAVMFVTTMPVAVAEGNTYKVGDIIQFGSYPQSKVTDSATITALNNKAPAWDNWTSYGYYSGTGDYGTMKQGNWMRYTDIMYNGNKYRGVKFTQYRPDFTCETSLYTYQDDNGYSINTVYWFKFKTIDWRVLDPATGLVMCETIIDSQPYSNTIYSNGGVTYGYFNDSLCENYASDYETSSIRQWLNNDFYNTAFTDSEKKEINTTTLNNDGFYTLNGYTGYEKLDSNSTNDKIFLLSYNEVINSNFGFNSSATAYDKSRRAQGSDYAQSQGLWVQESSDSTYNNNSDWLLRTPGIYSYCCCFVYSYSRYAYCVYRSSSGVRPALKVNLSSEIVHTCSYSSVVTKQPTHLDCGEMTYTCECGDNYTESIPKLAQHNYNAVVTNPTCTTKGYTTYTCECGDTYKGDYVDETGHNYISKITTQPTHLKKGVKTYTCHCGDTYTESIPKLKEHTYNAVVTKPTCTTQGYTTYTCECGDTYKADYVDKFGHDMSAYIVTTAPTCTSKGTETSYCSRCDYTKARAISTLQHTYGDYISDGKATCITDGSLIAKCDNCNATDTKPEKGTHKFSDSFIIDLDPTCTTDGQKSRHCVYCTEKTDITPIGKLGHTYNTITIDPTCTDRGHKIYTCLCGESYTETLPAIGHNFSGSVCTTCGYDKADDCTCNCHKTGLSALIWKILNFFYRLLRLNPTCNCGIAHY